MAEPEILGPLGTALQTIDASAIGNLTRAEIDQQIATAHRFPRDLRQFDRDAKMMVTVSEDIAEECIFGVKRGGEIIVGPSIRFAEVISHCYGNSRQATRIVGEGADFITAQGIFHDLEKNVAFSGEVQRRIVGSNGKRYGVDLIGVTGNAAASIALRNAILRAIPKPLWMGAYLAATAVLSGGVADLSSRRERALIWLEKLGVHPDRVFAVLGVRNESQVDGQVLVTLRALIQTIKDDGGRLDEVFPRLKEDGGTGSTAKRDGETPNGKPKADLSRKGRGATAAADGDQAPAGTDAPAETSAPASASASPAVPADDGLPAPTFATEDEQDFIRELAEALASCSTPNEVEALKDSTDESLQHQRGEVIDHVGLMFLAAASRVAPSASRKL